MNRHMYFRQQEKNALAHHGILGQKWGIRRFQNPDGTLTSEGKERYSGSKLHVNLTPGFEYNKDDKKLHVNLTPGFEYNKDDKKLHVNLTPGFEYNKDGKNVTSKKVTYEDNDVVCTEFKLKNGSSFNLQKYKHAPDRTKDELLEKYQNYALKEFDKNVFSDIDSKIKGWRKDPDILTVLKEYDNDIVNDAHRKNDFKNSKPGFSYNFMQHPLALECDWSINEYDRITFLVDTDGKIRSLPRVT